MRGFDFKDCFLLFLFLSSFHLEPKPPTLICRGYKVSEKTLCVCFYISLSGFFSCPISLRGRTTISPFFLVCKSCVLLLLLCLLARAITAESTLGQRYFDPTAPATQDSEDVQFFLSFSRFCSYFFCILLFFPLLPSLAHSSVIVCDSLMKREEREEEEKRKGPTHDPGLWYRQVGCDHFVQFPLFCQILSVGSTGHASREDSSSSQCFFLLP